jgi:toxin secretion/phage lysis holin
MELLASLNYCLYVGYKICENVYIKLLAALGLTTIGFLYDELLKTSIAALVVLVIFDFILGIWCAFKTGKRIQSAKIFRTSLKLTIYMMLISAGYLTERATQLLPFVDDTIIAFLAVTELISLLEHAACLGLAIPKKLLNQLEDFQHSR